MKFTLLIFIFTLLAYQANAAEVFSFVSDKCKVNQGFIINVNEEKLHVLDLDGNSKKINRSNVSFILSYDIVENPITRVNIDQSLLSRLRAVFVNRSDKALFLGWPIKIVEELVIFYDINGRLQVLEMTKITKVENVSQKPKVRFSNKTKKYSFGIGDLSTHCPSLIKKQKSRNKNIPYKNFMAIKFKLKNFYLTIKLILLDSVVIKNELIYTLSLFCFRKARGLVL